jgi:hypothetical protein
MLFSVINKTVKIFLATRLEIVSYRSINREFRMVEYAYTNVPGKIKQLLDKIRNVGVPPKVTQSWLKTIGFTSSNDGTLLGVLKFVGFTDGVGVPNSNWSAFRGRDHKTILGNLIQTSYAELYAVYPDAHLRSTTELTHVFNTSSSAGAQVVSRTVATFKGLCDEAEFSALGSPASTTLQSGPLHTPATGSAPITQKNPGNSGGPALHIDIQIHISAESTPQQIDKIFESMAKHLYGRKDE